MSLNKYMHPRNRYKNAKPSFLDLALKYADFRAHITQDDSGKVLLDFKNADALRALTTCLLKEDFDLTVELPSDRLVPTLPLRLNYIHWLEDIVGNKPGMWGIDIGTGASCVYPLLGSKLNGWNFLATEVDLENTHHAKKNVENNDFNNQIHVLQVTSEDALMGPLEKFTAAKRFDFCMCNPPFFADHMEAQAIDTSRSLERPEAATVSTASPSECIVQGGEVGFVRQMIEESTVLRDRIRVYSSMVGKKSSLSQLKEELRHQKVPKFSTTDFCQGKTMRWGIAWTFDSTVTFPRSHFESRKEKPPLQFYVPFEAVPVKYKVHAIAGYLKDLLRSMKIHCYQGKTAKSYSSITVTAVENTWCHQRRLRRQKRQGKDGSNDTSLGDGKIAADDNTRKMADMKDKDNDGTVINNDDSISSLERSTDNDQVESMPVCQDKNYKDEESSGNNNQVVLSKLEVENKDKDDENNTVMSNSKIDDGKKRCLSENGENDNNSTTTKKQKLDDGGDAIVSADNTQITKDTSTDSSRIVVPSKSEEKDGDQKGIEEEESPKVYILKCVMRLKRVEDERISLELEWLDGQSRELMHQVKTFLQNKLKVAESSVAKK